MEEPAVQTLSHALLETGRLRVSHSRSVRGTPVRILQIGDGNFLRAFADWMIDIANGAGLFNGRVTVVQPLPRGVAARLREQEGLYTVWLRGVLEGRPVDDRRVVSCVDRALEPYAQWAETVACAQDPSLRFVISNTTEAGIAHVEEPFGEDACPRSFPAKVASLLWARYRKLGGEASAGLVFLPCELIEANGRTLREIVLRHARAWALPAGFVEWVERRQVFCNTLVDRIVPGYPAGEADGFFAAQGYRDSLLVAGEPFHLWVIEGPARLADEFPLHRAGLQVVWTADLAPYRARKVRILNGAHTACALAAYGAGLDTVRQITEDPVLAGYLRRVMFDEIVPFVPLPDPERRAYAATILERFANPHIRHELISIALNSVSKWRVRVLPTVKDFAAARGCAPAGLAFSLAALLDFYRGRRGAGGEYEGVRPGGQTYPIRDDPAMIALLETAWSRWTPGAGLSEWVSAVLADERLWGEDLNLVAGLAGQVASSLERIRAEGVKPALAGLPGGA